MMNSVADRQQRILQQTDRAGATLDIISPTADPTSPVMTRNFGSIAN
jgi:hypothetical protein